MFPSFAHIKYQARIGLRHVWGRALWRELLTSLTGSLFSFPLVLADLITILIIFFIGKFADRPGEFIVQQGDITMMILLIHLIVSLGFLALHSGLRLSTNKYYLELATNPADDPETGICGLMRRFSNQFFLTAYTQVASTVMLIFLIAPGIMTAMKYAMAPYILAENPDMRPGDAVTESRQMMDGYKSKFFLFILSFLPWFIVGAIPFGLGLLWVIPYFNMSCAKFYYYLQNPDWERAESEDELLTLQSEHFSYKDFVNEFERKRGDKR